MNDRRWLRTSQGEKRGYIDPQRLRELWFHCGTVCNLSCPDCFEHSAPGDRRLETICLNDVKAFIDDAVAMGIEQFSFTGGEPFVVNEIVDILDYSLRFRPCLVLSNGTQPLRKKLPDLLPLLQHPNELSFRISIDFPDQVRHDTQRGEGMFELAWQTLSDLHRHGFRISIARRREDDEDSATVENAYKKLFRSAGIPEETKVIAFPNLAIEDSPEITENCMETYHSPESCAKFMCAYSRMVVKQNGKMHVYACTLVDDHPQYNLGNSLIEGATVRVTLGHPRCFACFAAGASCSEI